MSLPPAQRLRRLLEDKSGGLPGDIFRAILRPSGFLYGQVMTLRRRAYAEGRLKAQRHDIPVVSIGNITAGGTGKTPMIIHTAKTLAQLGLRVGIVARGYGSAEGEANDEEMLIREAVPGCIYHAHADRNKAIATAATAGAEVVLMDDGFQRLSTVRDLDILLIDALSPFGGGRVLPAGLLREPLSALAAAGVIVITRSDQVPDDELVQLRNKLSSYAPAAEVILARHAAAGLLDERGIRQDTDMLSGRQVLALSGIARPEAFCRTLESLGAEVAGEVVYPDHHCYFPNHLAHAWRRAWAVDAGCVVTTTKDMVKIRGLVTEQKPPVPLYCLEIQMSLDDPGGVLQQALSRLNRIAKVDDGEADNA